MHNTMRTWEARSYGLLDKGGINFEGLLQEDSLAGVLELLEERLAKG